MGAARRHLRGERDVVPHETEPAVLARVVGPAGQVSRGQDSARSTEDRMARRARLVAGMTVGALLLGVAGYGAADAYDLVPGVLTTAPVPEPAAS